MERFDKKQHATLKTPLDGKYTRRPQDSGFLDVYNAYDFKGNSLRNPINVRYPWRLIPWLGDSFELIYANENRRLLNEFNPPMRSTPML